jgi:hypothetical protein
MNRNIMEIKKVHGKKILNNLLKKHKIKLVENVIVII